MKIDFARGMRRLAYVFIGLVWLGTYVSEWHRGPGALGEDTVYLLIFTLCFMLAFNVAAWVIRGFMPAKAQGSSQEPRV